MHAIDIILEKLSKSKFRSSFKLREKDFVYIDKVGIKEIANHAYEFINKRLKPQYIENDGKQIGDYYVVNNGDNTLTIYSKAGMDNNNTVTDHNDKVTDAGKDSNNPDAKPGNKPSQDDTPTPEPTPEPTAESVEMVSWEEWASQPGEEEPHLVVWNEEKGKQLIIEPDSTYTMEQNV